MNVKKIFIISLIILIIVIPLFYFLSDFIFIPRQTKVYSLLEKQYPVEFYFYYNLKEYPYNNKFAIKEFSNLIYKKPVTRIKSFDSKKYDGQKIARFDWDYKGRSVNVLDSGQVLIYLPKSDIRNKSRLHWLWWKVDSVFNPYPIVFTTKPDKNVVKAMLEIKKQLK